MTAKRKTDKGAHAGASDSSKRRTNRSAAPLTFDLRNQDDVDRWNRMIPATGSPLSATYRAQFREIESSWALPQDRLDKYRAGLDASLESLDSAESAADATAVELWMVESERIIANASSAYLRDIGGKSVAGGKKGGESKPPPAWHGEAIAYAKLLLASGRVAHELTGMCTRKFGKGEDATRRVLQAAGLVEKRNTRV